MQILAISDVYAPRICGTSASLRALLREIQAKGHAVTLIAPDCAADADDPAEDVIRVSAHALSFANGTRRIMKRRRILELAERLRGCNYDIVHVHTSFVARLAGVALARRMRLPVVGTWAAFPEDDFRRLAPLVPRSWVQPVAGWLSRLQCHRLDGLIVPSAAMRARLEEYGVQRPIAVIPTAIDTQLFQRGDGARFRAALGIAPERPMLLHAGALGSTGDLEFLLAVLQAVRRQVADVLLVVAGAGSAEAYLRDQARRLELAGSVVFSGPLDRPQDALDCYHAADCFVSTAAEMPDVALLEALAAGLPVVTTSSVDKKDMLPGAGGLLLAEDNLPDFSAHVLRLLRDADLRSRLAHAGRQYAQQWSASLTAEQMLECYRSLIAARHRPRARALS